MITLIVCEGETEQLNFQAVRLHLGLTNAEVVIADNARDSAPISVVRLAEARCREPGGYDKVFCVFDRDSHGSFASARDRVTELRTRANNPLPIEDAVSIPCFEVWVLLHFERSDAPFSRCADVVMKIEQKHIAGYKKTDETIARDLMTWLPVALENGAWLAGRAEGVNRNPYTAVHTLLRHLQTVSGPTGKLRETCRNFELARRQFVAPVSSTCDARQRHGIGAAHPAASESRAHGVSMREGACERTSS